MKKSSSRYYLLTVLLCLNLKAGMSYTHVTGYTDSPKTLNPLLAVNTAELRIISQVHLTLFHEENGFPEPQLLTDFDTSRDQLEWKFILKKMYFHDGSELTAKDVVSLLHRALSTPNKISTELKAIEKIKTINNREFLIKLKFKVDDLPQILSRKELSITKNENTNIGLGPYKISTIKQNEIWLEAVPRTYREGAPKNIHFKKMSYDQNVLGFKKEECHDILDYTLTKGDLKRLDTNYLIKSGHHPKTFTFMINYRSLAETQRLLLINKLSIKNFLKNVYPHEHQTFSLISRGNEGALGIFKYKEVNNRAVKLPKKIVIGIVDGIGSTERIKNLKIFFSTTFDETEISFIEKDFYQILDLFKKGKIDITYLFMQDDSTHNFIKRFTPLGHPLSFVPNDDIKGLKIAQDYLKETQKKKKNILLQSLVSHVKNLNLFIPVFSTKWGFVFSDRYDKNSLIIDSPYSIKYNKLRLKEKNALQ